jgi:short-subunit dehydrogenase involved in D-alanine esterification of teichoic acids
MNISGNTIFIAGGTSGIGLGLALRFQAAGNRVIVGGRRTDLLKQIAAGHPVSRPWSSTPPTLSRSPLPRPTS